MLHLPKTVQTWCSKSGYLRKPMYTLIGVILFLYIYIYLNHITLYHMYIYSYIYIYIYTLWTEHNFKYKTIYFSTCGCSILCDMWIHAHVRRAPCCLSAHFWDAPMSTDLMPVGPTRVLQLGTGEWLRCGSHKLLAERFGSLMWSMSLGPAAGWGRVSWRNYIVWPM